MKKCIAFVASLAIAGLCFAKNHSCGIDIVAGFPLGFSRYSLEDNLADDAKLKFTELGFGMKIQTYDCFLLGGILGVYASAGFGVGFAVQTEKEESLILNDGGTYVSGDFLIGPAVGFDAGALRFQMGVAFHAVVLKMNSFLYEGDSKKFHSFGFALTPQVRFTADKRCSFVVGADLMFDFPQKMSNTDSFGVTTDSDWKNSFRFGLTPYLGLGINFGK